MTRKEFENVFESLSLTPDFMINMEKKLSAVHSSEITVTESENTASGVDRINTVRRSRIFSRIAAAAAGIAVMAGGVGIAARLSEAPDGQLSSHGFAVTESNTKSSYSVDSIYDINVAKHPNPLSLINENTMTATELNFVVTHALYKADYYSYYNIVPPKYIPEEYFTLDLVDAIERELAIYTPTDAPSAPLYFLIPDQTKDDLKNDMMQFFTEDYESNFDELLKEHNGKIYGISSSAPVHTIYDIKDVNMTERTESSLSFMVKYDLSDIAESFNSDICETPDMAGDLPNDDFVYTQKVTLKKTENGWRFSEYDSYKLVVEKFQETLYEQLKELNCK